MTGEEGCHSAPRLSPPLCHSEGRFSPLSVILRSFAPKNLSGHVSETGEKILRFAQNDRGERLSFGGALPLSVILRGASPPLSVILRSESDEESFRPCP